MDSIWNLWNYVEYVESTWNLWGSVKYTPKTWSKQSDPAAQYFYREMIKFEPNFLIANDTWKLEWFATDIYFNWSRQRKDNNDVKQEVKVKEISTLFISGKKRKASLPAESHTDTGGGKKAKTSLESSESESSKKSLSKFNIYRLF